MADPDKGACIATALHAHRDELRRFVASRAPSEDVDDVLSVSALRALEKADGLKDPDRVKPWLYRLHANVAIDVQRRKARERRLLATLAVDADTEPRRTDPACGCSLVLARQLNANYAAILEAVDVSGGSLRQAARSLGISVNNATVRLHRARAALKKRLQEHCGVTSPSACN
ncbi:MAG: sigma factor-like helix-turn-helix DNA-binding protein, partial [Pseudomonadota bacterium]